MTDIQDEAIMSSMNGMLGQLAEMEGHLRREALAVPFADSKREICAYYGVPMERVNVEYHRYHALWRCYQWDRTTGTTAFPSEERIKFQLSDPTLPAQDREEM